MKKYILALLLPLGACTSFLEEEVHSMIPAEEFFDSEASAELVVNGVYGTLTDKTNWGSYDSNLMMMNIGSFGYLNGETDSRHMDFLNYTLTYDNSTIEQIYSSSYYTIAQANYAIDGIESMDCEQTQLSEQMAARFIGEMKFLRALSYFNLVRLYGGVPLLTEATTDMDERFTSRSSIEAVYRQIISDLKYAVENLYHKQNSVIEPRYDVDDSGRATICAALGLLSKVYLTAASTAKYSDMNGSWNTLQDDINSYVWVDVNEYYTLAADYAKQLISLSQSGQVDVDLNSDYGYLFTPSGENSTESLFEVQFRAESNYGGRMGCWVNLLGLSNVYSRRISVDPELFNLYPKQYVTESQATLSRIDTLNSDPRLLWNIPAFKVANSTKAFIKQWRDLTYFKYRTGSQILNSDNAGINFVVLRYAEILLIYAEAINELGASDQAIAQLNLIRQRARRGIGSANSMGEYWRLSIGESSQPADLAYGMSQSEVLAAIVDERRMELAAEGHSRFDDVRLGLYMSNGENRRDWSGNNPTGSGTISFYQIMANSGGDYTPQSHAAAASNVKPYQQLFPIPKREVDINPNLIQNPYWN